MRRTALLVTAVVLALTGCGEDAPETTASPPLPSVATPSETAAAETQAVNERGNVVMQLGEEAQLGEAGGETMVAFTVDSIAPPPQCEFVEPPENGHLVALQMRVSTSAELSDTFLILPADFSFVGADGVTVSNLDTFPAFSCLDPGQQLTQDPLSPASQYVGAVVLDVPAPTGTIIYRPTMAPRAGWEWQF